MESILLQETKDGWPAGVVYAPNSIHHGHTRHSNSKADECVNLTIAYNRMVDFMGYLFDESGHCDHITQREAWDEFEKWEVIQGVSPKSNN